MRWVKRISLIAWLLSWFFLYREIFVWHHVTTSLRFNPPPLPSWAPPGTKAHAGGFLITVMAASALAPPTFIVAMILDRLRHKPTR
jgi:hypothetical protein